MTGKGKWCRKLIQALYKAQRGRWSVHIKQGVTYWGYQGNRQVERKVNMTETRSSGTRYVNWTHVKKDGTHGASKWTEYKKFSEWAKGIYEITED